MSPENNQKEFRIDFNTAFEFLKQYWIFILGFIIIFLSFLYLIKVAYDAGIFPPVSIIYLGIGIGVLGLVCSFLIYKRKKRVSAEICAGFSVSILYATLAYAAVAELWSYTLVFIVLAVLTAAL